MSAKFTPGPWSAEAGAARGAWIKGADGNWSALACGEDDETAIANRDLIAAAPELYEALEAVKQASLFVDDEGDIRVTDEPFISHDLFEVICAALRKARGETA